MPSRERPPAQRHSATSRGAADSFAGKAANAREQVLAFLRRRGEEGATDEEMQDGLGMGQNTQRPRRVELVRAGLVTGSADTRETKAGRAATVWKAVKQ